MEVCCYLRNATTRPPTVPPIPPILPPIILPTVSPNPPPNLNCICVDRSLCDPNGIITLAGEGIINPRQQNIFLCPGANQVCCRILIIPTQPIPTNPPTMMTPAPTLPPIPMTPAPTLPPGPTQICFVCNNTVQCISCGIIITPGGGGMIDPRFSQILSEGDICSATSNQLPCQGAAAAPIIDSLGPLRNPSTSQACYCVKTWLCARDNVVNQDGLGVIDPRFTACSSADQVCCRPTGIDLQALRNADPSASRGIVDATKNGGRPNRASAQITCGIRNNTYAPDGKDQLWNCDGIVLRNRNARIRVRVVQSRHPSDTAALRSR